MIGKSLRLLAVSALLGGAVVLTAGPASAAPANPCAHPGWRENVHSDGKGFKQYANIRSGPYLDCTPNGMGYRGDSVTYYCWRVIEGDSWTFLTDWTRNTRGWVRFDMLIDGGAPDDHPC